MKELVHASLLHGDCLTVTGKTLKQTRRLKLSKGSTNHRSTEQASEKGCHLVVPAAIWHRRSRRKISGKEGERFSRTARVYDSEEAAMHAILQGDQEETSSSFAMTARRAGMRDISPTSAGWVAASARKRVGTDAPGGTALWWAYHPGVRRWTLAIVKNGDIITIDAESRTIDLHVSQGEIRTRLKS
jgi:dihydroxy-acid dehydratase